MVRRWPWQRWHVVEGHPAVYAGAELIDAEEWIAGSYLMLRNAEAHVRRYGGRVVWHEQWEKRL